MTKKLKIKTDPSLAQFTIEQAADAILWHDSAARIKHANPAACDQFGYTLEELLSMTIQDINPNSTKQTWAKFWKELKKKKIMTFEDEHRAKDGRIIPSDIRVNYIEFEGREYAVGFNRDISKRKKLEEEKARAYSEIDRLRRQLELENEYLQEEVLGLQAFGDIVGQSHALHNILRQVEMVAPTVANVLIAGETGTGKELIAHEIHKRSKRSQRAMIRVNCASIPRELYESEFFGHVKGAFTGAVKDRAGRFELANGGTLFLDEVGEIPLDLQSKLLRVLQDGTFERVGDEKTFNVDVRVIAATNRNLGKEVENGRFREDLYYRLNVFPIEIAPLRKRKDDIPILANHFLNLALRKFNFPEIKFTKANLINLENYDWPGNARELQNVIERAVIISKSGKLNFDLPQRNTVKDSSSSSAKTDKTKENDKVLTFDEIKLLERENILKALGKTKWKIFGEDGAAELLGTRPTTLTSRIQRMGLRKD